MNDPDDAANIASVQETVRQLLASGSLSVSREVAIRSQMVTFLLQDFNHSHRYQNIRDAIQHLETILRRLPRDSPDRPEHLGTLSYVHMSDHLATNSRHALDEAVLNGRRAKDLADSIFLLHHNPDAYFEILTNFGYALSQRYALTKAAVDLEDAIACSRKILDNAPKNSRAYSVNLNNLASRLRLRHIESHNAEDIDEALRLIRELSSRTNQGTIEYAMIAGQLGAIATDKFNQTDKMGDLDEALEYSLSALNDLPANHETRVPGLRQIVHLYEKRYQKTADQEDLKQLVTYSGLLFRAVLPSNEARGRLLLDYMTDVRKLANVSKSLQEMQSAIQSLRIAMDEMPAAYPEKYKCRDLLANLLIDRYELSHHLDDLVTCVVDIEGLVYDYNEQVDKGPTSAGALRIDWSWSLRKSLRQLAGAPNENHMRKVAERELPRMVKDSGQPQDTSVSKFEKLYDQHGLWLEVLSDAIATGQTLTENEIASKMVELTDRKAVATRERQGWQRIPRNDYKTELGLRKLAQNENGEFIMDTSILMSEILGYDVTKKCTPEEFAANSARKEQSALNTARMVGRHPNTSLCWMCRDEAKVLQRTQDGFELTAKITAIPFGNAFQLEQRKNCAICSLILASITTKSGALHPRFSAMDPEVQGTRLKTLKLSTGEVLLRFDYGMKHAGEVRILTQENYSGALRQGWQVDQSSSLQHILDTSDGLVCSRRNQLVNAHMVKSWLNNCDHNHDSVCNHPRSGKRAEKHMPLTLIDVKAGCLVSASSDLTYFTLSYVWGQVDMSKTTKSNYTERTQLHSLSAVPLPTTIKDAMEFVSSLGERYLWTDALCIVQDDKEQMARYIPNMDIIYGQAFATIIALSGFDASAGLPGVRPGTREPQLITKLTISNNSPDLDNDPNSEDRQILYLTATPRPLHLAVELHPWNSRGWIVQEHLLSKRCIYFAPDAVYLQCGQQTLSEAGANVDYESILVDRYGQSQKALDQMSRSNPLSGLDKLYDLTGTERLNKSFGAYASLVEIYSRRDLSFKSDVLKAFAGIFAVLDEHFQSMTLHGLPAAVLSHALLWAPATRLPRRGAQLPTTVAEYASQPDPQFPSWSWVGWDGPVEFRLFETAKGEIVLPQPQIELYETTDGPVTEVGRKEGTDAEPTHQKSRLSSNQQTHRQPIIDTQSTFQRTKSNDRPDENKKFSQRQSFFARLKSNRPRGNSSIENSALDSASKQDDQPLPTQQQQQQPPPPSPQQQQIVIAKLVPDQVRNSTWMIAGPETPISKKDDPYICTKLLSFKARTVPVPSFRISPTKEYLSIPSQVHTRSSQAVRRILNHNNIHCGLWWEQAGYGYIGLNISPQAEAQIEMVEISRYSDAYHRRRDGPSLVEGPISLFDETVFPAVGKGSGLVNCLVVDFDMGYSEGIGERCTVAIVHERAWEDVGPRVREVKIV